MQAVQARRQLGLAELLDHLAVLHHQEAVGQRRGEAEILLDHDDGQALLAQRADRALRHGAQYRGYRKSRT